MLYLFVALFFFLDAVVIHILVCRQSKEPGLLLKIFFLIAGINLALCLVVFQLVLSRFASPDFNLWTVPLPAASVVFYVLLVPAYLVFYFSTQQMSPSKKIMLLLAEGEKALKELQNHFRDEDLVQPRIDDLLTTGCIEQKNGLYALTSSGRQLAFIYALYQGLLGRKKGG